MSDNDELGCDKPDGPCHECVSNALSVDLARVTAERDEAVRLLRETRETLQWMADGVWGARPMAVVDRAKAALVRLGKDEGR